jgi:hypothetical protein
MKVRDATILGFFGGLLLGGGLAPFFEFIVILVGLCGVIQVFSKKKVLSGPIGGFLVGLAAGYFLREFTLTYMT